MPLLTAGPSRFLGGGAKWWQVPGATCIAAYQPKGAADLAASYVNLANPGTYNAAPGVAPTLGANGWVFNGSTQYLLSGVLINGSTHSVVARFSGATTSNALFGVLRSGMAYVVFPYNGASSINWQLTTGTAGTTVAPAAASGVLAMIPGHGGYRNGVIDIALAGVAVTASAPLAIGARNWDGTIISYSAITVTAVAIYSDNPATVAANIVALTTRMQAL